MPKVEVNGVNLAYEIHGSGQPFVLVPGWTFSKAEFKVQIPEFSKKYQVIVYDQRGHGDSDKPEAGYSLDVFASDLNALIGKLNIGKAIILGHSMGGMIAQVFALTYPERVKALILYGTISSSPPIGHVWGPWGRESIRLIEEMGYREYLKWFSQYWFSPGTDPKVIEGFLKGSCFKVPQPVMTAMWKDGITKCNVRDRLHEIKVPTFLIVGGDDCRTPVEDHEKMNRAISNACLKIIKGTGHMANIEKPAEFNRAVMNFLWTIE